MKTTQVWSSLNNTRYILEKRKNIDNIGNDMSNEILEDLDGKGFCVTQAIPQRLLQNIFYFSFGK